MREDGSHPKCLFESDCLITTPVSSGKKFTSFSFCLFSRKKKKNNILTETDMVIKKISQEASQYEVHLIAHKVISSK